MIIYKSIENLIKNAEGFDWDAGNLHKNRVKHRVEWWECEEVFVNILRTNPDLKHSVAEKRYVAYGVTNEGRLLTVTFTFRGNLIRVISARAQNKQERKEYNLSLKEA